MIPSALPSAGTRSLRQLLFALYALAFPMMTAVAQQEEAEEDFAVYFPTGISTLSPAARKTLDSLVYRGLIHPGSRITITGWADEPGTTALNHSLSQRRAQAVAEYLTRDGFIQKEDISAVSGRGYDAGAAGRGNNPRYRRAGIAVSAGPPLPARPVAAAPAPAPVPPPRPPAALPRLDTMKANSTLTLDDVLFENASDVVRPSSIPQLEALLFAMRENPTVRIRIEGHVCCGDSGVFGNNISVARAKAVHDYLVRNGIAADRLAYQGFGFQRPRVFPEKTEEDQWRNRRVEVRILPR